jgi:hypothetical protein
VEKQASGKPRNTDRLAAIVERLAGNAAGIRYGQVAVVLKVHDGRITEITHQVTESTRENNVP